MFKKWKTVVALLLLVSAIVWQWWWFFSILFALQITDSLMKGRVEYVEEVKKEEYPFLFWTIVGIWFFLGIYSFVSYF